MKRSNNMLRFLYSLALIVMAIMIINVFVVIIGKVHVRSMTHLDAYVDSVAYVSETIYANRGYIYDANGQVVAQDQKTYDIICYLDPNRLSNGNEIAYVDDPLYTSQVLSNILGMDQDEIFGYLTQTDVYQTELGVKGRNLSEETKDEILSYPGIHGISFRESTKRIYPLGSYFASYLLGFAQSDEMGKLIGKMGVEQYLNTELSGEDGRHIYQASKEGYVLPGMYDEVVEERNGYNVYLTIDSAIQQALQESFERVVEENNASKAWGSVMEIESGKILAWGQAPNFDPNSLDIEDYTNYGSQMLYEPGSVMKSFIYAAAMDMGVYDGEAYFDSSPYCYYGNDPYRVYDGSTYGCVYNARQKSWGYIPLDYGLIYSSNVATSTLLSDYVGVDNYEAYLEKFGFFQAVNTDGILEETGYKNYTWPSEKLALTYGQGSSVTMLQLLQAYSAIFGNGEMVKPYFVDRVVDSYDPSIVIYQGERTVAGTPIKESTAKSMQALLERVVSDPAGTAQYYAIDEVTVMAKTGTSEIASLSGGYNEGDSITSVMLAFPADNPKYMIYYAYVSPYDYYNHTYSDPITDFIKRVAILTNVGYNATDEQIENTISNYEMPSLINRDLAYVDNKLNDYGLDIIYIGDGDKVVEQYPKEEQTVFTGQKIFLKTDSSNITCPDFTNWTRKEVIEYWSTSGLPIVLDGYGIAYEQSLSPGSTLDTNTELIIKFKDIEVEIKEETSTGANEDIPIDEENIEEEQ